MKVCKKQERGGGENYVRRKKNKPLVSGPTFGVVERKRNDFMLENKEWSLYLEKILTRCEL